jgi:hypothetical protein
MDDDALWMWIARKMLVPVGHPKHGIPLYEHEWEAWDGLAAALYEQLDLRDFRRMLRDLEEAGLLPFPKPLVRLAFDGMPSEEDQKAALLLIRRLTEYAGGATRDEEHQPLAWEFARLTDLLNNAREKRLGRGHGSDHGFRRVKEALIKHKANGGDVYDRTAARWADELGASPETVNRARPLVKNHF